MFNRITNTPVAPSSAASREANRDHVHVAIDVGAP